MITLVSDAQLKKKYYMNYQNLYLEENLLVENLNNCKNNTEKLSFHIIIKKNILQLLTVIKGSIINISDNTRYSY